MAPSLAGVNDARARTRAIDDAGASLVESVWHARLQGARLAALSIPSVIKEPS
jgi:hypothetical protein